RLIIKPTLRRLFDFILPRMLLWRAAAFRRPSTTTDVQQTRADRYLPVAGRKTPLRRSLPHWRLLRHLRRTCEQTHSDIAAAGDLLPVPVITTFAGSDNSWRVPD